MERHARRPYETHRKDPRAARRRDPRSHLRAKHRHARAVFGFHAAIAPAESVFAREITMPALRRLAAALSFFVVSLLAVVTLVR